MNILKINRLIPYIQTPILKKKKSWQEDDPRGKEKREE